MEEDESRVDHFLNQHKLSLLLSLVGIVLIAGGVFSSGIIPKIFLKSTTHGAQKPTAQTYNTSVSEIMVDVSGAVNNPGVYALNSDSRVEEAILKAGGVMTTADPDYLSKSVNLAQKIQDGMKIYIPFKGEKVSVPIQGNSNVSGASANQSVTLNINTASTSELEDLPGIGPVTADKIVAGRPYASLEELLTKKSVSKATYEKIKSQISVY